MGKVHWMRSARILRIDSNCEVANMKKVRITVKKIARYDDLIAEYENPIEHACSMQLGQTFVCNGWERPEGFCSSTWDTVSPFVMTLGKHWSFPN